MSIKRVFFGRDLQRSQALIHRCRKPGELRSRLNSNPEQPWRARIRKKSVATESYIDGFCRNRSQRPLDFLRFLCRLLPDEFQSDVQGFWPHPTNFRSEAAHALEETGNSAADLIVNIEGNKKAHKNGFSHQLPSHHIQRHGGREPANALPVA